MQNEAGAHGEPIIRVIVGGVSIVEQVGNVLGVRECT